MSAVAGHEGSEPYVFISYSRQDRPFVQRLSDDLNAAGVQTWTDVDNIAAGADWKKALEHGLLQASVLVYVASAHSSSSGWMDSEVSAVLQRGGRVIPVVIDDAGATHMPETLAAIQWVDFRSGYESALAPLIAGIQHLQQPKPIVPAAKKSKGYVFVSYADEDSAFVQQLKKFLADRGYGFWDFRDSPRDYQVDYSLELERIIRGAAGTLSVISPEWKQSPTSMQELHFSREVKTPVFLLRVRDPGPTLALSGFTFIDFTTTKKEGFSALDKELRRKGL